MNFELLREMDSFSEEMLNRIIAFQTKEHAAWNSQLPFAQRIQELTLHDLVLSHPQRDPKLCGPTIAHYAPRRDEMWRIAAYARAVASDPVVCELHARNGFLGSLLARENVRVIGLRDPRTKPNQIADFYDNEHYDMRSGTIAQNAPVFDLAFSAWMPSGENHTPALLACRPKIVVYVYTEHADPISLQPQTGTTEAFTQLSSDYKLIDQWQDVRPADFFKEVWPDLTGNLAETRITRVYARTEFHNLAPIASAAPLAHYDWEKDLQMASLALEAKQFLKQRGIAL
ncbi:MAG: hypothetical protein HY273_01545 [Gammaproteobacteria bacterium]|nr:hypothetical protein [Gammaproteobacteria bacterium]